MVNRRMSKNGKTEKLVFNPPRRSAPPRILDVSLRGAWDFPRRDCSVMHHTRPQHVRPQACAPRHVRPRYMRPRYVRPRHLNNEKNEVKDIKAEGITVHVT
jgi:hypothetical protein